MISADKQFSYREELIQYLELPLTTRVSHKFSSSFDAEISGNILHFTANPAALTPLSLLLPEEEIITAQPGFSITLRKDQLSVGKHDLCATLPVKRVLPPAQIEWDTLNNNLGLLRRNIELFGRSSLVLDLILHRQPEPLNGVTELLSAKERDLTKFARYFGAGEGLTPSFDDFLAGMLFLDRFYGFNQFFVSDALWKLVATKTTRQAVQQYRFAANGQLSRQFEQVVADLVKRKLGSSELVKLLGWGHSSGTDILCGVWFYFSHQVRID